MRIYNLKINERIAISSFEDAISHFFIDQSEKFTEDEMKAIIKSFRGEDLGEAIEQTVNQ